MKISRGAALALASATLFGASTPFAKRLVGDIPPVLLAGLLYVVSRGWFRRFDGRYLPEFDRASAKLQYTFRR